LQRVQPFLRDLHGLIFSRNVYFTDRHYVNAVHCKPWAKASLNEPFISYLYAIT
jgi:hypothetical protein